jgi:hypothetical protein
MNVKKIAGKMLAASVVAMTVGLSSHAIADEDLVKRVQAIKIELAQMPGVTAGIDRENSIVTLYGYTDDLSALNSVIAKIKDIEGVKEVRSSVTH